VEFLANGYFEEKVLKAGLSFRALGDRSLYHEVLQNEDIWHPRKGFQAIWKALFPTIEPTYKIILDSLEPNTVLVGSTLALAARLVQEKFGVPLCTIHLAPSCIISIEEPPVGPGIVIGKSAPHWLRKLYVYTVEKLILDGACCDDLNKLRRSLNLPAVEKVFSTWLHSPDMVLCAWSDWFGARQSDWPKAVFGGFPLFKDQGQLSGATAAFLDAGPAAVFTAGSAMAHSADYFARALKCIQASGERAIFVSKFRDQIAQNLPPQIHVSSYEPFDLLFSRASAVAHHGGIGTSAQCLAAGVPQLVAPFAHDQFDNAQRLKRLGVASVVDTNGSVRSWQRELAALKQDSVILACARVKELMNEDGAGRACELLLEVQGLAAAVNKISL
jgi:rhamnosyltransferase subunit B